MPLNRMEIDLNCAVFVQVVDLTTGARIGPGKEGEICVKSELMMLGYLNQEEATEAFYDNEGFAKMGDVGYYDIDGTMHFKERIKEMIKYAYESQMERLSSLCYFFYFQVQQRSCIPERCRSWFTNTSRRERLPRFWKAESSYG